MIKKILYISIFSSFLLIISCGKNSNNITKPTEEESSFNSDTIVYTASGIDKKYNNVWYFYNTDNTGNKAVNITIQNGGISGLIASNKNIKVNFNKENIYSIKDPKQNHYYDRYFGYIISSDDWLGEIHFPIYDDETVGYVYIKNKNNSDIIAGMINSSSYPNDGIDDDRYYGKRTYTGSDGLKRTLEITKDFLTYSENNKTKVKVPASFFEGMVGQNFRGYSVLQGLLYNGISINSRNANNQDVLPDLYFEYYDYNYKLDIKVNDKGVPISAKYNKKEDLISSGDILYKK